MDSAFSGFRREAAGDRLLSAIGRALGTLSGALPASRPNPADACTGDDLRDPLSRELAGSLMRVNHVGEICAQALYEGQAASTRDPGLASGFRQAAAEEADHLAWTAERLRELGARPSLLNPVWFAGAFGLGLLAGRAGDRVSLGFMAETERQVEEHLNGHLERLPMDDHRSRAIVSAMRDDEARHAQQATAQGGVELPAVVRCAMRASARLMTVTAHRV
jgi:3-demethoxyubiquinol 3-hydroxylase